MIKNTIKQKDFVDSSDDKNRCVAGCISFIFPFFIYVNTRERERERERER